VCMCTILYTCINCMYCCIKYFISVLWLLLLLCRAVVVFRLGLQYTIKWFFLSHILHNNGEAFNRNPLEMENAFNLAWTKRYLLILIDAIKLYYIYYRKFRYTLVVHTVICWWGGVSEGGGIHINKRRH